MAAGHPPFYASEHMSIYEKITSGKVAASPYSLLAVEILRRLCVQFADDNFRVSLIAACKSQSTRQSKFGTNNTSTSKRAHSSL